ncbi:hypothetical protein AAG570_006952 [Ranatra chinensis]|uniref:Uncharacterized protein n=1 Tax=Ranatra chinensis TaxID=642074 RepID=A0ABD0YVS2_9HEMI
MALSGTSKSFVLWKETPLPMYIDLYMFNWTNPEKTLKEGAKPHFEEIGPYVFTEEHTKVNIVWNKNGTVSFKQVRKWNFVPHLSVGNLYDKITNINVVAMTVGAMIKKIIPKNELPIVDAILKHEEGTMYVTKTVGELLFDGYDDKFLSLMQKLKPFVKIDLPFDRFGWFVNRNGSADYDGVFNMDTGTDDLFRLGKLYAWNFQSETNFFSGSCSKVKGTSGELWPPNIADHDTIEVFAGDICSSATLVREQTTEKFGIEGTTYIGNEKMFDNGTVYPENKCYCLRNGSDQCQPSGTRDLSSCRYGAPAFVSFPHFYLADPSYRELVSGMNPSEKQHQFTATLAKDVGIPLEVNARLQINIYVEPIQGLLFYDSLPSAMLPQLWFNQRASITEDLASQLSPVFLFKQLGQPLFFTICGIGVFLLLLGVILLISEKRCNRQKQPLLLTEDME